jgi:hypothetical protein
MENSNPFQDASNPRRSPTPGGMYRRAEIRAHAESIAIASPVAAAPVELSADPPSFSGPDIIAAIGHVDPVVRTIVPLADTVVYTPGRPSVRQARASFRRRRVVLATLAVGVIAVIWLAWPTPSITAPAPSVHAAPVPVIPPAAPTSTPSTVQPLAASPASTEPGAPPARTRAVDPVLRITSDPVGARVTVNGVGWGATPVVIRNLPPGAKTIRVTKEGYVADQRVLSFSGASSVQLRLRRTPDRPAASTPGIRPR